MPFGGSMISITCTEHPEDEVGLRQQVLARQIRAALTGFGLPTSRRLSVDLLQLELDAAPPEAEVVPVGLQAAAAIACSQRAAWPPGLQDEHATRLRLSTGWCSSLSRCGDGGAVMIRSAIRTALLFIITQRR